MATSETWNDNDRCPFCGAPITTPGVGFINHVEANPDCKDDYETWRNRVADDVAGGWMG